MNKEDKQGYMILVILMLMAIILGCTTFNAIRAKLIKYEYYKDGQFGISKTCYINDKDECMCLINGKYDYVDSYYIK